MSRDDSSCGHLVGPGVIWELSQGFGPRAFVLFVSPPTGMVGLPHSMAAGFQKQVSPENQAEGALPFMTQLLKPHSVVFIEAISLPGFQG